MVRRPPYGRAVSLLPSAKSYARIKPVTFLPLPLQERPGSQANGLIISTQRKAAASLMPFPNSGGRHPLRYIAWATRTARDSAGQAPQCGKYLLLLARLAEIHTALSDWAALRYGRFSETSLHFFTPYRIGA